MTAAAAAVGQPRSRARPAGRVALRAAHLGWPLLVVVLVVAAAQIPVLFDPRYYFVGDTESGAWGQWYAIGARVLAGHWGDVLDPTVGQAGVLLADGAWGFFSPILWLLGLVAHSAEHILTAVLLIKTAILVVAGVGVYVLGRSFGVPRPWAALAGVAVPLNGFTDYQDISSWITGALSWSLLPWAWAGLRAFVHGGRNLLLALIPAALLLGIVYTHASLVLIVVVLAVAVEAIVARRGRAVVRMLVAGVAIALMVVIAHLPALLVYPDTSRSSMVVPPGSLVATPASFLQAMLPFGGADVLDTGGDVLVPNALTYVVWLLPLVVLIRARTFGRLVLRRTSLPIVLLATAAFAAGPTSIGPLRWPLRVMPYVAVAAVVLLVLGLARARVPKPGPIRLVIAALLLAGGTLVTASASGWSAPLVVGASGIALLLAALTWALSGYSGRPAGRARTAIVLAAVVTVGLTVPQHAAAPIPGGPDQELATSLSTYRAMLKGAEGDVFVVGDERSDEGVAMASQAALGNAWYLTGRPVQNTYTTLQDPAWTQLFCQGVKGATCSRAYHTLFTTDPDTGRDWVDLLGVSSILLIKTSFLSDAWQTNRPGWHTVSDTPETRLIVRDAPVPGAGSVVWTSAGTAVRVDSNAPTAVRFTVLREGPDAALDLSRLPFPGYSASGGASLLTFTSYGLLTRVELPPRAVGRTVTVAYTAPGTSGVRIAALGLGVVVVLWVLLALLALPIRRLRRLTWRERSLW